MSEPFTGQIQAFGFNFAPRSWGFCSGALLSPASNQALFSLISTFYGGDGRTTFALPNLVSRTPIGFNMGNSPGLVPFNIGNTGGRQQHSLQINEMPTHNHAATFTPFGGNPAELQASTEDGDASLPSAGAYLAQPSELPGPDTREQIYKTDPSAASLVSLGGVSGGGNSGGTVAVANTGGNQAFSVLNPFLAVNFCIAMQGLYPSRS